AGINPAKGRSGSATLQARALVGHDGTTLFEVTTGALDAAAVAPGNIDKLQLKLFGADGLEVMTENFTGLTGGRRWQQGYGAFARREPFQVQANVCALGPETTD